MSSSETKMDPEMIKSILESPSFKEYSRELRTDLSPTRPLASILDKFSDLELALYIKYYAILNAVSNGRGFEQMVFNQNLVDPLLPGFRKMNFHACMCGADSELEIRGIKIKDVMESLVKPTIDGTMMTTANQFIDYAKRRIKDDFCVGFESKLIDTLPSNFGGKILKKQKDESERLGMALMMRRIAKWEANGRVIDPDEGPDYDEEHKQEFRDALFLVLIDQILIAPRTMKQVITYFLFIEIVMSDFKLYHEKVLGVQKPKRPSKQPGGKDGKETRQEFVARKQREAVANADILSEYYVEPVRRYTPPKVLPETCGTLTEDALEKHIYFEEEKKTTFVRELTQDQVDEQEAMIEQIRLEKIRKREMEQSLKASEKKKDQSQPKGKKK